MLDELGQCSRSEKVSVSRLMLGTITEKPPFRGMRVKVKVYLESRSMDVLQVNCQFVQGSDFREHIFVEFVELTVEVFPAEAGPEVSCDYSIRVQHGDDMEDKGGSKHNSHWIFREKERDEALEDIGGM